MPEIKGTDTTKWVAIVGCRQFDGGFVECGMQAAVEEAVGRLKEGWGVVSGGATGVDSWTAAAAQKRGLPVKEIKPDYERYGKGATFKRNQEIVDTATTVLVYWDGKSRGTADTVVKAWKAGKLRQVFYSDGRTLDGDLGRCVAVVLASAAIGEEIIAGQLYIRYPDDMVNEAGRIASHILSYGQDPAEVGG